MDVFDRWHQTSVDAESLISPPLSEMFFSSCDAKTSFEPVAAHDVRGSGSSFWLIVALSQSASVSDYRRQTCFEIAQSCNQLISGCHVVLPWIRMEYPRAPLRCARWTRGETTHNQKEKTKTPKHLKWYGTPQKLWFHMRCWIHYKANDRQSPVGMVSSKNYDGTLMSWVSVVLDQWSHQQNWPCHGRYQR